MKPFNIEQALERKAVITRDGREVAQIKQFDVDEGCDSLAGVIDGEIRHWKQSGKYIDSQERGEDLFMKPIKKEGWVNVYSTIIESREGTYIGGEIFGTKEDAIGNHRDSIKIDTIKIEWEE